MNAYARTPDIQADGGVASTSNAAIHLRNSIAASREIDDRTLRHYFAYLGTRYIDVPEYNRANQFGRLLWLPFDIVSITSLKELTADPLTYGTTLVEGTDFLAYTGPNALANEPMIRLDGLNGQTFTPGPHSLQVTGVFGYSYETEDTGQTVQNATSIADNGTSLQVTSSASLYAGEIFKIDSEQVLATAIADATHVTIERAKNGTTAAAHLNGATIYRRRYPREIEEAARMRAMDFFIAKRTGLQGQSGEDSGFSSPGVYRQFSSLIAPFKRMGVS